ncbi:MAG: hypothetical protein J1F35_00725 [Erysipelotrichales bacterium]|nr:hypothetical protein [Erysipelotrichales bacterium]
MEKEENLVNSFRIINRKDEILKIELLDANSEIVGVFLTLNWSFLTDEQIKRITTFLKFYNGYYPITISREDMEILAHIIKDDENVFTIVFKNNDNFDFISIDKNVPYSKGINKKVRNYCEIRPNIYILVLEDNTYLQYNIETDELITVNKEKEAKGVIYSLKNN